MPTEAREWKASALLYAQRVKSVNAKLSTGDAFVDLSTVKSPYNTENNQPIVRPILLEDQEEWIMLQSPQRRSTNKAAKMRQLEKERRKKAGLATSDDEDSDSDDEGSEDDALLKERAKPKQAPMFSPSGKVLVADGESAKRYVVCMCAIVVVVGVGGEVRWLSLMRSFVVLGLDLLQFEATSA